MDDSTQSKKRNSFRNMMFIVFVILICFGLTIYGIVYLTGKVFNTHEKIQPNVAKTESPVNTTTNPEEGEIMKFSMDNSVKEEKSYIENKILPDNITDNSNKIKQQIKPPEHNVQAVNHPNTPLKRPEPLIKKQAAKKTQVKEKKPVKKSTTVAKKEIKPAAKPAPKPAAASAQHTQQPAAVVKHGKYVVQILAAKSKSSAEHELPKYKKVCSDVFIQKANLGKKGEWYRIRCGVTDSLAEAKLTIEKLTQEFSGIHPQIVTNK